MSHMFSVTLEFLRQSMSWFNWAFDSFSLTMCKIIKCAVHPTSDVMITWYTYIILFIPLCFFQEIITKEKRFLEAVGSAVIIYLRCVTFGYFLFLRVQITNGSSVGMKLVACLRLLYPQFLSPNLWSRFVTGWSNVTAIYRPSNSLPGKLALWFQSLDADPNFFSNYLGPP